MNKDAVEAAETTEKQDPRAAALQELSQSVSQVETLCERTANLSNRALGSTGEIEKWLTDERIPRDQRITVAAQLQNSVAVSQIAAAVLGVTALLATVIAADIADGGTTTDLHSDANEYTHEEAIRRGVESGAIPTITVPINNVETDADRQRRDEVAESFNSIPPGLPRRRPASVPEPTTPEPASENVGAEKEVARNEDVQPPQIIRRRSRTPIPDVLAEESGTPTGERDSTAAGTTADDGETGSGTQGVQGQPGTTGTSEASNR